MNRNVKLETRHKPKHTTVKATPKRQLHNINSWVHFITGRVRRTHEDGDRPERESVPICT